MGITFNLTFKVIFSTFYQKIIYLKSISNETFWNKTILPYPSKFSQHGSGAAYIMNIDIEANIILANM